MNKAEMLLKSHAYRNFKALRPENKDEAVNVIKTIYEATGWIVLPFWGKGSSYTIYCNGWNEVNTVEEAVQKIQDNRWHGLPSGLAVLTKPSGLTVVDVDNIEKFEAFTGKPVEDFIRDTGCLAIRTKSGGYHFYFRKTDIPGQNRLECCGYEVKSYDNRGKTLQVNLVMWDENDNQLYQVVEDTIDNFLKRKDVYPFQEDKGGVLGGGNNNNNNDNIISLVRKEANPEMYEELYSFSGKVVKSTNYVNYCCPFHPENNPSFSVFKSEKGFWLWKDHHDDSHGDIIDFYIQLEKHFKNRDLTALEAAVELCKMFGIEIPESSSLFTEQNWVVYKGKKPIGASVDFLYRLVDENGKKKYKVAYKGERFILDRVDDLVAIKEFTGIPIVSENAYKEYILWKTTGFEIPEKRIFRTTGWNGDVFLHPAIQTEDIWELNTKEFRVNEPEKHKEMVRLMLKEGGILGVLYTIALATTITPLVGGQNLVVYISGESGKGKTLASMLACKTFYDIQEPLTLNATTTGLELLLKQYKDLPVLLDEEALSGTDLEKIIFMVASGKGKVRGTKNLTAKFSDIKSNVFITSEKTAEDLLKRIGAFRRVLFITVKDTEDFTKQGLNFMKSILDYSGAGVLFVKWLLENRAIVSDILKQDITTHRELAKIEKPVLKTILLLEEFYGEDFWKLKEKVAELFTEMINLFNYKGDTVERFVEEFKEFVVRHKQNFIDEQTVKLPAEIYGFIDKEGVYVLTTIFNEFLKDGRFHKNILLDKLEKEGILIPGGDGKRKRKRIPDIGIVSVYHFRLSEFQEPEKQGFTLSELT